MNFEFRILNSSFEIRNSSFFVLLPSAFWFFLNLPPHPAFGPLLPPSLLGGKGLSAGPLSPPGTHPPFFWWSRRGGGCGGFFSESRRRGVERRGRPLPVGP